MASSAAAALAQQVAAEAAQGAERDAVVAHAERAEQTVQEAVAARRREEERREEEERARREEEEKKGEEEAGRTSIADAAARAYDESRPPRLGEKRSASAAELGTSLYSAAELAGNAAVQDPRDGSMSALDRASQVVAGDAIVDQQNPAVSELRVPGSVRSLGMSNAVQLARYDPLRETTLGDRQDHRRNRDRFGGHARVESPLSVEQYVGRTNHIDAERFAAIPEEVESPSGGTLRRNQKRSRREAWRAKWHHWGRRGPL